MRTKRNLTSGECELGRHVFGGTIPLNKVEISIWPRIYGGYTPYGDIHLDEERFSTDFIGVFKDKNPPEGAKKAHFFLHELVHTWQHYVGMLLGHGRAQSRREARQFLRDRGMRRRDHHRSTWGILKNQATYSYDIGEGEDLMDFTLEQQGEIIADYFALKLWEYRQKDETGFGLPKPTLGQFESVLAKFRADPGYPADLSRMNRARSRYRGGPG